jgi:hypothetical protein
MRVCERSGDLQSVLLHRGDRKPVGWDQVAELVPINQLHHDERLITLILDLVHRADARMVQGRRGSRFVQDSFAACVFRSAVEQLDGDIPLQLLVVGAIHGPHATSAQLGGNAISANLL